MDEIMEEKTPQPVQIVRGTTKLITVVLYDEDGNECELEEGEFLRFGVSQRSGMPLLIQKEIDEADINDGEYIIALTPEDTQDLKVGRYYYDIGLQSGDDYFPIVEFSPFDILPNVTRRADNA